MCKVWWILVGLGVALAGCNSGRLMPEDIEALMRTDEGQWILKSVEGHGGIWRWRQRPYVIYDYGKLLLARGVDTTVTNRRRDTTISPYTDTLVNLHEHITLGLREGLFLSQSASQNPLVLKGFNGDSLWLVRDGVPEEDSSVLLAAAADLARSRFYLSLPFVLLDTTYRFSILGEQPWVDTTRVKGQAPGTYDTTLTPFNFIRLKVDFPAGAVPVDWLILYLDDRDGQIRRTISPGPPDDTVATVRLTVWSNVQEAIGLKVGGRRLSYPSDGAGAIQGPFVEDYRFFNVEFPRQLEEGVSFVWTAPPPAPDSTAVPDSTAAPEGT